MPTRPKRTLKRAPTMKERRAATQDRLNHRHPSAETVSSFEVDPNAAAVIGGASGRPPQDELAPREEVRPRGRNAAR